MHNNFSKIKSIKPSGYVILIFILAIPFVNLNHHKWNGKEGVIVWDIKSYYAYLPAAFIYHDMSYDFIEKYPEKKLNTWIWASTTPTGKRAIITSSGLSMMYAPFFFIAHTYATLDKKYEPDGYSKPYHIGLVFSAFVYFILSLFVLRKILRKFFSETVTAITLFTVAAGTNLFYYVTYEAPLPHVYTFFLIVLFTLLLINWHEKPNLKTTVLLGLVSGLFVLIRPTNIIVLLLIPLYGVLNWKTFTDNIKKLLKNWHFILIMALFFFVVWIPQFVYWYYVSGKIFYFSYAENGGKFFFNNPQISDFLFSFKKGWYVYTPIMLIATFGLYFLYKTKNKFSFGITVLLILFVYALSSWWCWWFGGSFSQRSMVDFYGLMALPLAALISYMGKNFLTKMMASIFLIVLIFYNQFQTQQYRKGSIHFWWMNKEAYFETFLTLKPTCKYWKIILIPDYEKARQGIYVAIPSHDKYAEITDSALRVSIIEDLLKEEHLTHTSKNSYIDSTIIVQAQTIIDKRQAGKYFKQLKIKYYSNYINGCQSWRKELEQKAKEEKTSYDVSLLKEATRVFDIYSEKYEDRFN
jgi:4-amino-4-deoxy-L-arabinose transferase-like glycosyltransferase